MPLMGDSETQWILTCCLLRRSSQARISLPNQSALSSRRLRHWLCKTPISISAMLSQLACLGVWWISAVQQPSGLSGGNACYKDAPVWVLRLSSTKRMRIASG